MRSWRTGVLAGALVLTGCGGDDSSTDSIEAVPGTALIFDLDFELDDPDAFFDFPYPSDLRLDAEGRPRLAAFPNPKQIEMLDGLVRIAGDRRGFPTIPVGYFRFDGPLAARTLAETIAADPGSPILLVQVSEHANERGRLFPTIARTLEPDELYVPDDVLAVAAHPGIVLPPERTYAFVIQRSVLDAAGQPLGVPESFALLKAERGPEAALTSFQPLWDALDQLDIRRDDVAGASVFSTGDVVKDTEQLSTALVAREAVTIENLAVDPTDGAAHPRFCELHGSVRFPQLQQGTPPFDTDGSFVIGGDGLPVVQREEVAPVVITLPRIAMPASGYPLVAYFHGSGGLSTQVVDRAENGAPSGRGPAHVLGAHGFATVGSAHPLNPERLPGAGETEYLNFDNLSAFRDTFRQGIIEQRLLIEALSTLEIDPAVVTACALPPLPSGATAYRLDLDPLLAMGQSMGGMYANLIGAVEPRIGALVPTGAGGFWSLFIVETELVGNLGTLAAIILGLPATAELAHVHPVLHLLQTAWEPAEPMVYMPRLGYAPLVGHPVRSIYEPVGKDDSYFPTTLYDAIALAYGHRQAGELIWPSMQDSLAVGGLDGILSYPVVNDLESHDGQSFTGVVVQYAGDGSFDAHEIFSQLDSVKYQYGCFFETFAKTGSAVVAAPAPLGSECP